jgi:hypothetical protein
VLGKDYQRAAHAFTEALDSLYELMGSDTSSREEGEDLELLTHKVACNAALAGMFCADPDCVSAARESLASPWARPPDCSSQHVSHPPACPKTTHATVLISMKTSTDWLYGTASQTVTCHLLPLTGGRGSHQC